MSWCQGFAELLEDWTPTCQEAAWKTERVPAFLVPWPPKIWSWWLFWGSSYRNRVEKHRLMIGWWLFLQVPVEDSKYPMRGQRCSLKHPPHLVCSLSPSATICYFAHMYHKWGAQKVGTCEIVALGLLMSTWERISSSKPDCQSDCRSDCQSDPIEERNNLLASGHVGTQICCPSKPEAVSVKWTCNRCYAKGLRSPEASLNFIHDLLMLVHFSGR